MKRRKRGRPEVWPDYLLAVFQIVEQERHRHPNLSVNSVCELIAKRIAKFGPMRLIDVRTGEMVEIASGRTLRSRYHEVLSALSSPTQDAEVRYLGATRDDALLVDGRTGRILGGWGPTKKNVQARRKLRAK